MGPICHLKVRFYHILHIPQQVGCPLNNIRLGADVQRLVRPVVSLKHISCQDFALYFIAADTGELHRFDHMDLVDDPP